MVPETMAAVLLTGHGGPDKLVYREDVPVPTPEPGEVLIRVSACGMNNTDVWVREGAYGTNADPDAVASWRGRAAGDTLTFPRIQGADTVGRVVAVGEGVPTDRIGDRVMVDFSMYNRDDDSLAEIDHIGHGRDGGYADYCAVPADNAHRVHRDLADAELATFCCAGLTAEHMLDRAGVGSGEHVLVTGASGGVGSSLVQLCRARNAVPFAVTSRRKAAAVAALGAEVVIVRGDGPLSDAVATAAGGRPVDVVVDLVAGPLFPELLDVLRPEGRYVTAGAIGGPLVRLDLRTLYLKHLQLHGSSQGTRAAFRRLLGHIETGRIRPVLAGAYRLSDFARAQRAFMAKEFVGKLVVVPDRTWTEFGAPFAA